MVKCVNDIDDKPTCVALTTTATITAAATIAPTSNKEQTVEVAQKKFLGSIVSTLYAYPFAGFATNRGKVAAHSAKVTSSHTTTPTKTITF